VGGGRLLKQHGRLLSPAQVVSGFSTTLTAVKLHEEVNPETQCVV
jgi:hypothetical protein